MTRAVLTPGRWAGCQERLGRGTGLRRLLDPTLLYLGTEGGEGIKTRSQHSLPTPVANLGVYRGGNLWLFSLGKTCFSVWQPHGYTKAAKTLPNEALGRKLLGCESAPLFDTELNFRLKSNVTV